MKALVWHGKPHIQCDTVPDPKIVEPTDLIIKVASTAICGSDLHLSSCPPGRLDRLVLLPVEPRVSGAGHK